MLKKIVITSLFLAISIIGYGQVTANHQQISGTNNFEGFQNPNEINAEETIRSNQTSISSYKIGDEWTYETDYYFGGGHSEINFSSYSVLDTFFDGIRTKYLIKSQDTVYIEDHKMYFWDEYYHEYIVYYDWQETESYDIKYYDPFRHSEEIATVFIDSISYKHFGTDSLQVQHVRILNSGTFEDDGYIDEVYEGIGANRYGEIQFLLGCGLCEDNPIITKLRCFTNETMTYQFVPYPCDTIYLVTVSTKEIDSERLKLSPNPTNERVYIDGIDSDIEYQLYNLNGQLIKQGTTYNKSVNLDNSGIFILKLKVDEYWIAKRVVKLE